MNGDGSKICILEHDPSDITNSRIKTYQFITNANSWTQYGTTIISPGRENSSISINESGDVVAIGNPTNKGNVIVYDLIDSTWVQKTNGNIDGIIDNEKLGKNVSLNKTGTIICINGENTENKGITKVYQYANSIWSKLGNDIVGNLSQNLGNQIDINDNGNIITLVTDDTTASQKIYTYRYINDDWSLMSDNYLDVDNNNEHSEGFVKINGPGNIVGYFYKKNTTYHFSIHEWPTTDTVVDTITSNALTDKLYTTSNVGIGTANPSSQLHIFNQVTTQDTGNASFPSYDTQVLLKLESGYDFDYDLASGGIHEGGVAIGFHTFNAYTSTELYQFPFESARITAVCNNFDNEEKKGDLLFLTNHNGAVQMPTDNLNTDYERMRIMWNGNVGIGTQIPGYPLHVNGTIGIGVRTDWGAPILQHTPYVSEDYFSIGFSTGFCYSSFL